MVRGRLIDINDQTITPNDFQDENARRLVDREFNLSYTEQLPSGNRVTSGRWIEGNAPQVSIETGIAKTLKLKLGDQLTFEVAGEKIKAPITSLRKLDWGSMRVNFFVIMPPSLLGQLPQSWITSYYQPPNGGDLDFRLSQNYPNLTVVDVSTSLQQIQEVLNKLTAALGLLFAFTIIAAILVLIAAISATQDERFRNAALLKALGASRKVLAQIATIELVMIGAISGLLAGIASGVAAWALGRFVLEIEFHAFAQAILMGLGFGISACLLAGYRFQKKIQNATAIECLRTI
jgi:putative ABC transport system permease protein